MSFTAGHVKQIMKLFGRSQLLATSIVWFGLQKTDNNLLWVVVKTSVSAILAGHLSADGLQWYSKGSVINCDITATEIWIITRFFDRIVSVAQYLVWAHLLTHPLLNVHRPRVRIKVVSKFVCLWQDQRFRSGGNLKFYDFQVCCWTDSFVNDSLAVRRKRPEISWMFDALVLFSSAFQSF